MECNYSKIYIADKEFKVIQMLDKNYGCFLWPSAVETCLNILKYKRFFETKLNTLELGCGLALPSLSLSNIFANNSSFHCKLLLTDKFENFTKHNLEKILHLNKESIINCNILHLDYNDLNLVDETLTKNFVNVGDTNKIDLDLLFFTDLYYDKSDFENITICIRYILQRSKPEAICYFCYQERSCKRSLNHLFDINNLEVISIEADALEERIPSFPVFIEDFQDETFAKKKSLYSKKRIYDLHGKESCHFFYVRLKKLYNRN
ncbi:hypothetical protein HK099_002905 [Clydaea vesicula]|uniref:Uncharacterized protein n=1 Tax=Clydaea vesicula TaxID=447962 RepID=A0AAD5U8K6_9FUNG|nr:hypothetical protein HK099_002905 [Clydaea vesicula]